MQIWMRRKISDYHILRKPSSIGALIGSCGWGDERQCQIIHARLIDMLLTSDKNETTKLKKLVYKDFQEIDQQIALFTKTAPTGEAKRLVLSAIDSLLVYRRACATYVVLMDENKISEASLFLRFNVHRSFSSVSTELADIPELLVRTLQSQSDQLTSAQILH